MEPMGRTLRQMSQRTQQRLKRDGDGEPSMPSWLKNSVYRSLPDHCRVKCDECHGNGSNAGVELAFCLACQTGYEVCPLHKCRQCDGAGAVCPTCRGMRFIRDREWDPRWGGGQAVRCPTCTEGNNINRDREMAAVRKYLLRWRTSADAQRDLDAERRAERDAYQAEWRANNGSNKWARQRAKRAPTVEAETAPESTADTLSEPEPPAIIVLRREEIDDDE